MSDQYDDQARELLEKHYEIGDAWSRNVIASIAKALREAYETGRVSRRPRAYNTHKLQELVGERDGWTCHYCGVMLVPSTYHYLEATPLKQVVESGSPNEVWAKKRLSKRGTLYATIDHVIPHSKGGSDEPDNLVLSCSYCNSNKSARSTEKVL